MLEAFHGDRRNPDRWQLHPLRAELRQKAKDAGLWNLWVPAAMAEELQPLVIPSFQGRPQQPALYAPTTEHWQTQLHTEMHVFHRRRRWAEG